MQAWMEAPTWVAIRATELVFAWSLLIQTLEYLRMGKYTADDGFWSWTVQRADIPNAPVRACLTCCSSRVSTSCICGCAWSRRSCSVSRAPHCP